ncbi:MAG: hypothetical protein K8R69_03770 [Deltaproteobacteria bacterium]|nr:hypothetical protein [Deltaproteobacteria bacterium]
MPLFRTFYSLRSNFKRFSVLAFLAIGLAACGSAGGINLPAPVADLEGGTVREATVCDTVQGAPVGAFVRVRNISDSQVDDIDTDLAADGSFSVLACVQSGQTLEIQVFNQEGAEISGIQQLTRGSQSGDVCPTATNPATNCP